MKKENKEKDMKAKKKIELTEKEIEKIELEEKLNELEILKQSLDEKKSESEKYYEQLLRLKAEFENYRKRTEKESGGLVRHGKAEVITSIFPVLDSFEKAIPTIQKSKDTKAVIEGINMIYRHMKDILKKNGLKRIESIGKNFDPNIHHAVLTKECKEEEDNNIIEEMQAGYTLEDRVVRPAMVVVGKHSEKKEVEENKGEDEK